MSKMKKRIDTGGEQGDLTDNPFANLGNIIPESELAEVAPVPTAPLAEILYKKSRPYTVGRTRKGGWPVRKEKRNAGKIVTLIGNTSGDRKALMKELQKTLGVGGKVDGDTVQLQGEHVTAVERFLDDAFQ
jgi:translation initiation factor 1 (eIF-1/SUI1)